MRKSSLVTIIMSSILLVAMSLSYWLQTGFMTAITYLCPSWVWAILGILLIVLRFQKSSWRPQLALFLLWVAFLFVFSDEPTSIIRSILPSQTAQKGNYVKLRVISLNCGGGNPDAAREVEKYHPDIVLFQESPSEAVLRSISKQLFGSVSGVVCDWDTSIISSGKVSPIKLTSNEKMISSHAVIHTKSGLNIRAVSLRLLPTTLRTDVFSHGFWEQYGAYENKRRSQLKMIMNLVGKSVKMPVVVGGDFNTPASSDVLSVLKPMLHDSFKESGIGWGDTILNDIPLQRIDQIWLSNDIKAISCRAQRTLHSDHRMVICDILLPR